MSPAPPLGVQYLFNHIPRVAAARLAARSITLGYNTVTPFGGETFDPRENAGTHLRDEHHFKQFHNHFIS